MENHVDGDAPDRSGGSATEAVADLACKFDYLDKLRQSGRANMFGAAPYVADAFGIPIEEARTILGLWTATFSLDVSAGDRARAAIAKATGSA